MPIQKYSVNHHPIQTLLSWVKAGEIAIPEIQRPFVWSATKVRNLMDSLYRGYPIGYLIAWRNPSVKLKDGSKSGGKRILIDGQQRVGALMAALLREQLITKDYRKVRIKIAFQPKDRRFEVCNPAIEKDSSWIADIADVLHPDVKMLKLVGGYCEKNPGTDLDEIFESLELLKGILDNHIGLIELNADLDIETVTEIFIRVNSEGVVLSQSDFAMSKIAANEKFGGSDLRKAIDYFCHLAVAPDFYSQLSQSDPEFAGTKFFKAMAWLKNETDDLYDPSYTDMLRVAFTSEFNRGRLADLVALLSGRNFETRQYQEEIAEQSFTKLKHGIFNYMNENNFKKFVMIICSAGFVDASLIGSQNTLNFAYALYLTLRSQGVPPAKIERAVRKWFVLSILTGRYSGSAETMFDHDIRQVNEQGFEAHLDSVEKAELSGTFWETGLPQALNTSVASSPYFRVFRAAQAKMKDKGFLSHDITVQDLIAVKGDVHHVFPRSYLKRHGMRRRWYNQIANYVMAQSEINIAIGDKPPKVYFSQILEQCGRGEKKYGGITDLETLRENLAMNCIPERMETMDSSQYETFLRERRKLMARKIRDYYTSL